MERDPIKWLYLSYNFYISTHTLTWSVTYALDTYNVSDINFNSHAHVERDFKRVFEYYDIYRNFNSHAHVERDLKSTEFIAEYKDFNSHAHVERDT